MPLFSVIIPNYNHEKYLKERIESVLSQTIQDFELIILDDGSHDNSKRIIEQYRNHPRISHVIYNEKNSGSIFKQWGKGIALARGEWIWIAESDDEAFPHFLETALQSLKQQPSAGIFYSNAIFESTTGTESFKTTAEKCNALFATNRWNTDYFISGQEEINGFLSKYNTILNASSAVLHKNTLSAFTGKLGSVNYLGDWLSYLHIASGKDIVYSSRVLNKYRRTGSSAFHQAIPGWKRKRDHFIVFDFLRKLPFLQDKDEMEHFHIVHYLDIGFYSDKPADIYKTIKSYFEVNTSLALRVIIKIILRKLKLIR